MKINLPFLYQLKINRNYSANKVLLPIGCDCHPAHLLSILTLRKESLPFDWLDIKSHLALNYIFENIQSDFKFFLTDLYKNVDGKVFSKKYPESLFYHYDNLIDNFDLQNKIMQRVERFLILYKNKKCCFIHTIAYDVSLNEKDLNFIVNAAIKFSSLLKPEDQLMIYLRFDELILQDCYQWKLLENRLRNIKKVKVISYVLEKNKFGMWGDEKKYKELIINFGIKITHRFPKISLMKRTN